MAPKISSLVSPGIIRPNSTGAIMRAGGGTPQNVNGTVVRIQQNDCAVNAQDWATMQERMKALAQMLGPAGPQSGGYDFNAGLSAQYTATDPFNGGTLATDMVIIPDNAAANTVYPIAYSPDNKDRLQGTMLLRMWSQISNTTVNGGALLTNAGLCSITAFLNGYPLPQLNNIPLASITPNLIGTPQAWEVPFYIRPSSGLRFELRVNQTLLGLAGQTSGIQIIAEFGIPAGRSADRINGMMRG